MPPRPNQHPTGRAARALKWVDDWQSFTKLARRGLPAAMLAPPAPGSVTEEEATAEAEALWTRYGGAGVVKEFADWYERASQRYPDLGHSAKITRRNLKRRPRGLPEPPAEPPGLWDAAHALFEAQPPGPRTREASAASQVLTVLAFARAVRSARASS